MTASATTTTSKPRRNAFAGGLLDADLGDGPDEPHLTDPGRAQRILEDRVVERSVAELVDDHLARSRRELVDDLWPSSSPSRSPYSRRTPGQHERSGGPHSGENQPRCDTSGPCRVTREEDRDRARPGAARAAPSPIGSDARGVGNLLRRALAHEVVLEVDDDERGGRRIRLRTVPWSRHSGERLDDVLGDQLELLEVGGHRVEHQVLHPGVDPGLHLGLDLVDRARHVDARRCTPTAVRR